MKMNAYEWFRHNFIDHTIRLQFKFMQTPAMMIYAYLDDIQFYLQSFRAKYLGRCCMYVLLCMYTIELVRICYQTKDKRLFASPIIINIIG